MSRQFVLCKFHPGQKGAYTYHNDGEPVTEGDKVRVPHPSGDGWKVITVVGLSNDEPTFATKGIIGKHVEPLSTDLLSGVETTGRKPEL